MHLRVKVHDRAALSQDATTWTHAYRKLCTDDIFSKHGTKKAQKPKIALQKGSQ